MNCRSRRWFLGDFELNIRRKGNIGCHVTTSQRRDVTTISAPALLKARGDLISGYRGTCGFEGKKQSNDDPDYWRRHFLLYFLFSDKLQMIVRLIMFTFSSNMF